MSMYIYQYALAIHLQIPNGNTPTAELITDTNTRYIYNSDTTPPSIAAITDITRFSSITQPGGQRINATGQQRWTIDFTGNRVVDVDAGDFELYSRTSGASLTGSILRVENPGGNRRTVFAQIGGTYDNDTSIDLRLAPNFSIFNSNANDGNRTQMLTSDFWHESHER